MVNTEYCSCLDTVAVSCMRYGENVMVVILFDWAITAFSQAELMGIGKELRIHNASAVHTTPIIAKLPLNFLKMEEFV